MNLTLHVWRQANAAAPGKFVTYRATNVSPDSSFLEMLDVVNEELIATGGDPIAFDHDCREGICGACGVVINGSPHGPKQRTTTCQLHMRSFKDGDDVVLEPWRATAFPVVKDLIVDRGALDRIIAAGGFISAPIGSAPDGNALPIRKENADRPWTPPPASAAAPAWRPVPTPRRCCSPRRRPRTSPCCRRARASGWSGR